ncbi:paramyosin [Leptidea sinapis]|uniref:paramyosin n=1 Tax=Leptidea sinapis TaxID=189913 RepID=UPI00213E0905|nr:paramyosin [Leptidea sinapis]
MSETDDTDVLLLIPPNFFLVQSSDSDISPLESSRTVVHKPVSCTAQVLGKLVDQVHTLKSRLESIELDSNISASLSSYITGDSESIRCRSIDRKCFTFPRRRRRKYKKDKAKDSSLTSLDTISNIIKFKENARFEFDECHSMDGDISSIVSSPSKKNNTLFLNEIDEYLSKVESFQNPNRRDHESVSPENIIKATGDYLKSKYDCKSNRNVGSANMIPDSNILEKYIYLNNPTHSEASHDSLKMDQKAPSIPSDNQPKSPTVRRLNFSESRDVQSTSTPKRQSTNSQCTFKPSSNKVYNQATKMLEQYNKSQSYSCDLQSSRQETNAQKEEFKMPQMRPFRLESRDEHKLHNIDTIDTDLISLSELWGGREGGEKYDNNKLEEERLKREHCEAMIQQLQRKILEQQEKLAVAVKVDRSKDAAINKMKESWFRLTSSLDKAEERHRSALDEMNRQVDNFKIVAEEAQKKTKHFESELYKALDLAHDYQEKYKQLSTEKIVLQDTVNEALTCKDEVIRNKDREIEVLKENYETVMRLNKQSTDCAKNLEDALEREKSDHDLTKAKINELNIKIDQMTDDKSLVLQERDMLKVKITEEKARSSMLERQLCDTQNQLSDMLRKCDSLDNETKNLRKHLELQKSELKSHYQQQLEEAVIGKLQEFQKQLDLAERDMEAAARRRENVLVESYNKQILRIEEQHRLEVNVLEEKQKEEIKLCRLQLAQATEKIGLLESKVDGYRRRRGELAAQLHSVMEAQWRQALSILTDHTHHQAQTPRPQEYTSKIPPLSVPSLEKLLRDSEGAHRGMGRGDEDPPRDRSDDLSDTELHDYVRTLLSKPVKFDASEKPERDRDRQSDESRARAERHPDRQTTGHGSKPPWKA